MWACAYDTKYLGQIDNFFRRAYKFRYTSKQYKINEIIVERDRKMWVNITGNSSHPLNVLLPMMRSRSLSSLRSHGHNYVLPKVSTERFKRIFVNRCLFKFVNIFWNSAIYTRDNFRFLIFCYLFINVSPHVC